MGADAVGKPSVTYLLTHTYLRPGTLKCRQVVARVGYEKVWLSVINCETPVSLFVCLFVCVCVVGQEYQIRK